MKDGTLDVDFSEELQKVLGAIQIRPAIVHVQDKGQQKVVAFYASPASFPRIPGTFVDHKAYKRIVHYKQPDVHTTERTSNIYVKETKTDHHVGAHNKGLCQGARLSGFFPYQVIVCRAEDLGSYKLSALKSARETLLLIYLTK